jgi:hypothetical protein
LGYLYFYYLVAIFIYSLIKYVMCKYFLSFCELGSHFLYGIVCTIRIYNFDDIQLICLLYCYVFSIITKNILSNSESQGLSPTFYCKDCIVSAFIFRSMIYFELIFDMRKESNFVFFGLCISNCSRTICGKGFSSPHWIIWEPF